MLEALERIERQLVDAAAAQQREAALPGRTWNPPRITVALLSALVLASGASAVTGVGPFGDVFDGDEAGLTPAPDGASATVSQSGAEGTEHSMRAYENRAGALCIQSPPVTGPPAGEVAFSCAARDEIARAVARDRSFAAVSSRGGESLLFGLVPGGASAVRVQMPGERARDAAIGGEAIRGFRPFLAVLEGPVPSGRRPAELIFDDGSRGSWPPRD